MKERENAGPAEIQYGQGFVRGKKVVDRVCFRGLAGGQTELCVPDQKLVSVDVAYDLENLQADGILGFSPAGSDQFLRMLRQSRRISRKVFSVSLD